MPLPTAQEVINQYLYGQATKPGVVVVRPPSVTSPIVNIDVNLYRQGLLTPKATMEAIPAGSRVDMKADGSLVITKPDHVTPSIAVPAIAAPPGGSVVAAWVLSSTKRWRSRMQKLFIFSNIEIRMFFSRCAKALISLFLCAVALFGGAAVAQQRSTEKPNFVDCANAKVNPGGPEWCDAVRAERAYQVADQRLNRVYRLFMRHLDEREKVLWTDAQRKWLAFHKAHCNAIAAKNHPSPAVMQWNYMECLAQHVESRTQQLLDSCEVEQCKHVE